MDRHCQIEYTEVKLTISLIQGGYYYRNIPWADSETDQNLPKCKFQVKLKKGNQFLSYDLEHISTVLGCIFCPYLFNLYASCKK